MRVGCDLDFCDVFSWVDSVGRYGKISIFILGLHFPVSPKQDILNTRPPRFNAKFLILDSILDLDFNFKP